MPTSFSIRLRAAGAAIGLSMTLPALAGQVVYWPSFATSPALVGAPDLTWQTNEALVAKFERRVDYPGLAALMGLTDAALGRYDVIAWEGNGGSPGTSGGWESVQLTFDDFHTAVAARYDEVTNTSDNPAVQFLTGSIDGARYDAFFGTHGAEPVMSWLLVDLPASINARSPSFSVRYQPGGLSPGGRGEGTPDADAIGVIASVPEPATLALTALALVAMGRLGGRRRDAVRPH